MEKIFNNNESPLFQNVLAVVRQAYANDLQPLQTEIIKQSIPIFDKMWNAVHHLLFTSDHYETFNPYIEYRLNQFETFLASYPSSAEKIKCTWRILGWEYGNLMGDDCFSYLGMDYQFQLKAYYDFLQELWVTGFGVELETLGANGIETAS